MNEPLIIENEISINAPASKVWNVLINPEETKKYMFGCEAISDWKIGSPLIWKGSYEGNEMIFVKGSIINFLPEKFLAYTAFDPNNKTIEDIPENYLTVTYSLTEVEGQTHLSVTQGDYARVGDGENRYKHSVDGGGWQPILEKIKKIVEELNQ